MRKIKTLLIANRGEIACRIIKTAKRLGLKTIAIYAEPDKNALHCQLADESYCVGPAPSEKSYLNIHNILHVAKLCKADAIHPGYGFLSENAQFAKQCVDSGFIFVGPSSTSISQMAVKDEAKRIMAKANVPTVPGYMGTEQQGPALTKAAQEIGYPLILKAAKGGGGKGMRVVLKPQDLDDAIETAKRESQASFGDDSLFIEKYLINARHIEVQIFRDKAGNAVHLFERDCSLQRRHQKIIEESPALDIPPEVKQRLYQAAINAANAIDYVGAGTIEFLLASDNQFYFMEMNTRLQVEHPVTEMVTGLDLVEWQLLVADGQDLPLTQSEIQSRGNAIEARIYAEDSYNHFLPATGTIKSIMLPNDDNFRLDTGVQVGDSISIYFDPMLAKMIVHAQTRSQAIQAMQHALSQYHIVGVTTNLPFLRLILQNSAFQSGKVHTQFIESNLQTLIPKPRPVSAKDILFASLVLLIEREKNSEVKALDEPNSPWNFGNAWRVNLPFEETVTLHYQLEKIDIQVQHPQHKDKPLHLNCATYQIDEQVTGLIEGKTIHAIYASHQESVAYYSDENIIEIFHDGQAYIFKKDQFTINTLTSNFDLNHTLLAPMPGIISKIWVKSGEKVNAGTKLVALEAMKMEHTLSAPTDGLIKSIHYKIGDQVEEGCELIDFE